MYRALNTTGLPETVIYKMKTIIINFNEYLTDSTNNKEKRDV